MTYHGHIKQQMVPANMIPEVARDKITTSIELRQPIAELADLVSNARRRGDATVNFGVPGGPQLVAIINHQLAAADERSFGPSDLPPTQIVERIYWSVSATSLARVLDVVRTTLVELVAEMRAGTPSGQTQPTREVTEQAVDVAIYGRRNRVVINQVAAGGQGAAALSGASSASEPETRQRRIMWWVVAVATVVAAVAAIWGLIALP